MIIGWFFVHGLSMDIHGYPWISMDIHGYPWIVQNGDFFWHTVLMV